MTISVNGLCVRIGRGLPAMLACVIFAAVAVAARGTTPVRSEYVDGEVIVSFKPSVSFDSARQALTNHSLSFARHFTLLSQQSGRHTGLVRDPNRATDSMIAELVMDPTVEIAEPNFLRHLTAKAPNDTLFSQLWGLQNTGQLVNGSVGTSGNDIQFVPAWVLARPSTNPVVVAVIDTGVDYTHPDIATNIWVNPGEIAGNGVDDDSNGYADDVHGYNFADGTPDPTDSSYHGTHVAGTIAAPGNNQMGIIGVNYQAQIMALKVSSDGFDLSSAAIIEAVQYAILMKTRGGNVVALNASFGGGGWSATEIAVIQAAGDAGIIYCAGAGNDSANNDTVPFYPASYRLANMIVIAATDQADTLASFSNYGANTVDLSAPGVNILSTQPTWLATTAAVQQVSMTYPATALAYSGITTGVTASIYDCGLGYPTDFPPAVSNQIALISRGTLYFSEKVANAMAAGARAAVIYNNLSGNFSGTLQSASNWIPAVAISQADGLALAAAIPNTGTVVNSADLTHAYQVLSGTSMAAPHVAGAVAFAAMNFPAESVTQRVQRVLAAVDVVPGLEGKVRTGGRLNLRRTVDADGNGLPDWWEQIYFSHLTGTDPNGDADHDGAINLAEWIAGTDPTDAASAIRLFISRSNLTNFTVLQWPSVSGKFYQIQLATNLSNGFDSTVQNTIVATPPTNTLIHCAILPSNASYYRLRVEQ